MRRLAAVLSILLVLNGLLGLAIAHRYATLRDAWQRQRLAQEGCAALRGQGQEP